MHDQLMAWLRGAALPLWDERGVDRSAGGYFETLSCLASGSPLDASGDLRRGRVVARQIYVFDAGHRVGWTSQLSNPVNHGCEYLFARLYAGDGLFHTAVDAKTHRPVSGFSLYEHAFYLFVLARLDATQADQYPIAATAARCLERLRVELGKSSGGFEESIPATLPLRSNPHMHLLEAALAWVDTTDGAMQRPWIELAEELADLCLGHFVDRDSGALRECFDFEWQPMPGDDGRIVEPGHQFEWAWLLLSWAASPHSDAAKRPARSMAARRLVEIGERCGVDPIRGVAINEIWDDMTAKDSDAKLWPQTERLKAWCAMFEQARTASESASARNGVIAAARGLLKYLRTDVPGLWHEVCSGGGGFSLGPSKASSFYHIVCAIMVFAHTLERRP